MGFSKTSTEKSTHNMCSTSSWVIAGVQLKPIYTGQGRRKVENDESLAQDAPTTPTSEGCRIPAKLPCPPPPRKRKPAPARCNGKREFFVVPHDLEAVFIRRQNVGC